MGVARAVGFVALLAASPIVARSYGLAGLGVFASVVSLNAVLSAVDSGLGASIRTQVAEQGIRRGGIELATARLALQRSTRRFRASAVALGAVISLVIPWEMMLPLLGTAGPIPSARLIVCLFVVTFVSGSFLQIGTRALEGADLTALAATLAIPASLGTLGAVSLAALLHAPLAIVVIIPALAPWIQGAGCTYWIRRSARHDTDGLGAGREYDLRSDLVFPMTIISVLYAGNYNLDYFLILWLTSESTAGVFTTAARPAQLMLIVSTAGGPILWNHFVKLRVAGDENLQLRTMSLVFGALGVSTSLIYLALVTLLGSALSGGLAEPGLATSVGFAVWGLLLIAHQPLAMKLSSPTQLRLQTVSMVVTVVVNLSLSAFLVTKIGAAGAIWGSVLALLLVHIPALIGINGRDDTAR